MKKIIIINIAILLTALAFGQKTISSFKILDKDEQTKTSGYFCYLNLYSKKQIQEMIS